MIVTADVNFTFGSNFLRPNGMHEKFHLTREDSFSLVVSLLILPVYESGTARNSKENVLDYENDRFSMF